jgi:hypothetical protein
MKFTEIEVMAKTKKQPRPKRNIWFSSTFLVLIAILIVSSTLGIWRYGLIAVFDESLKYIIGATFTAIVIYIVTRAKQIKLR